MAKVLVHVEGQTEERFVKDLLQPHLEPFGVSIIPKIATTKVVYSGPNFKGGLNSYETVKKELLRLLGDTSAKVVTTMYDYYGLPRDFPGRNNPRGADCYEKASHIEKELYDDINHPKLLPYLQIHEFENLLFSSPSDIAKGFPNSRAEDHLLAIRRAYSKAEEINDGEATHPSKRLTDLFPEYQKPLHGSLITNRIGLPRIRNDCPHFDKWLRNLEGLAN